MKLSSWCIFLFTTLCFSVAVEAAPKARRYGPLRIFLGQAKLMNGSVVIPAKNSGGQDLFVGVFCDKKLFNFTGSGFQWGDWERPLYSHEEQIVRDACR